MGGNAQPAAVCNGCGICVLPCPAWWNSRDMMVTPRGILRALQENARAEDLRDTLFDCSMCGACEPACPLDIDILGTFRELRGAIPSPVPERVSLRPPRNGTLAARPKRVLVPGPALIRNQALLNLVLGILGTSAVISVSDDDGHDLALTLETGAAVESGRVKEFLAPFRKVRELVVVEGILHRFLRRRMPRLSTPRPTSGTTLSAASMRSSGSPERVRGWSASPSCLRLDRSTGNLRPPRRLLHLSGVPFPPPEPSGSASPLRGPSAADAGHL